ncbi:hypothetical protein A176_003650 [Myxococcus hansupus]|uniref:Uncharacterized protein n=1 Tax=Pseudomyxococcus hansupus TaxID=1297742 RepID=A0A0H4WYP6_9BACT|nr:hypothetical protein A176_003650 [Myxococcus hansupus]
MGLVTFELFLGHGLSSRGCRSEARHVSTRGKQLRRCCVLLQSCHNVN